ncbi:MAG TPA: SPOR domain-containing protein [Bacteroidales bacterium]|jgi:hypothetical protein|nr:SPOR domain-containing protein [Bacteroidales bacterium]
MSKKVTYITLFLFLTTSFLPAQQPFPNDIFARLQEVNYGQGKVQIKQDAAISNLVNLHVSLMKDLKGIKGFRVCIYYNSGQEARSRADQERAKFISRYEDVSSDKVFESPFWKVYVGNFRTKSEALKFLEKISYDYPNAFIRDNITVNFPE